MSNPARKCCCNEGLACEPWCQCSPPQVTLTIRIQQEIEIVDDTPCGTYVVLRLEDDMLINAVLQRDCPCGYGTVSGNFVYSSTLRQYEYPSQNIYVNNNASYRPCPQPPCECTTPVLCSEQTQYKAGTSIGFDDIRIECDQLCSNCEPQCSCFTAPQNVLRINMPFTVLQDGANYNECLLDLGVLYPNGPINVPMVYTMGFVGFDGCIDQNTFSRSALELTLPFHTPWQLYFPLIYYGVPCFGDYPRYECDPGTGAITVYRGTNWDVALCKETVCVGTHRCYNNAPTPANLVYECACTPVPGQTAGTVTRTLKHTGKYTITMTIP